MREDTAELASLALSDIASSRSEHSPLRHHTSFRPLRQVESRLALSSEHFNPNHRVSSASAIPELIQEAPEAISPSSSFSSRNSRCQSALTELFKISTPNRCRDSDDEGPEQTGLHSVTVEQGIISQPDERTRLLGKSTAYGLVKDIESQNMTNNLSSSDKSFTLDWVRIGKANASACVKGLKNCNKQELWKYGVLQPARLVPPVILGLLLNVLDALSYGQKAAHML